VSALLDSTVLVAALASDEERHAESLALLKQGGNFVHAHAFLETFSTLTGGRLGVRANADFVARMLTETVLPRIEVIRLETNELMEAIGDARQHGVRGGAVYDYMHLVAARKAGADTLYTLNLGDFLHLRREGDPDIRRP